MHNAASFFCILGTIQHCLIKNCRPWLDMFSIVARKKEMRFFCGILTFDSAQMSEKFGRAAW